MKRLFGGLLVPVVALGLGACTVDQTEEGAAPDVDVEGGNLPEYDVEAADVDVEWDTTTVRTPTIDVNSADTTGQDTLPR